MNLSKQPETQEAMGLQENKLLKIEFEKKYQKALEDIKIAADRLNLKLCPSKKACAIKAQQDAREIAVKYKALIEYITKQIENENNNI